MKTEYPSSALVHSCCDDRDDHVETMDRQNRRNRPIKFLDDSGDCDDRDDHMETRLKSFNTVLIITKDYLQTTVLLEYQIISVHLEIFDNGVKEKQLVNKIYRPNSTECQDMVCFT